MLGVSRGPTPRPLPWGGRGMGMVQQSPWIPASPGPVLPCREAWTQHFIVDKSKGASAAAAQRVPEGAVAPLGHGPHPGHP